MCSWLRRFVPHFSSLAAPLYETIKGSGKLSHNKDLTQAFDSLKLAMSQISVLKHPNQAKKLYLQTDSSYIGVGAVLFQLADNGDMQILQFASRLLKNPEKN
jgi:hypothetical protein